GRRPLGNAHFSGKLPAVARLVAIEATGGDDFVSRLLTAWETGNAVLPVDPRLPAPARAALVSAVAVSDDVESGDALVMATSGTTGDPKGVVLTHAALHASGRSTGLRLAVDPDRDHWLACLPLAHVGGLSVVTRALVTGTPVTVLPGFDVDAVESAGATLVSLVATALSRIDSALFRI